MKHGHILTHKYFQLANKVEQSEESSFARFLNNVEATQYSLVKTTLLFDSSHSESHSFPTKDHTKTTTRTNVERNYKENCAMFRVTYLASLEANWHTRKR